MSRLPSVQEERAVAERKRKTRSQSIFNSATASISPPPNPRTELESRQPHESRRIRGHWPLPASAQSRDTRKAGAQSMGLRSKEEAFPRGGKLCLRAPRV
ncbi:hypothetical protein BHE74_00008042 [Ensete ventricosum]|nr:hypothetical protein GW17_00038364 [Ensete ventricosum]RWW83443.1 hypothetical protein BHE74_00008042 [Ensete ventricosum]RZR80018.1 hypothetical protein BHM03_00005899 [Ensete ventricosum]